MKFESLADVIAMGGHGPYVWAAYAIALVVLLLNVIWPLVSVRRNLAALREPAVGTEEMNNVVSGSAGE